MIGDRMKELRLNKGLSMDEMAKIIGVSSSSVISRYENKQTKPKEKNIIKYADYFNVSVDWLKYGDLENYIYKYLEEKTLEDHKKERDSFEDFEELSNYESALTYPLYSKAKTMAQLWNKERYPNAQEIEKLYNKLASPRGYKENLIVQANTLENFADNFRYFINIHNELNDEIIENLNKYRELLEEAQKQAQKTLKLFK